MCGARSRRRRDVQGANARGKPCRSASTSRTPGAVGARGLGASRRRLLRDVLFRGASLAVLGLIFGGAVAFALNGSLGTLLYGISPRDPATYALAALFVLGTGLAACWIPARRAGLTDPLSVIRE